MGERVSGKSLDQWRNQAKAEAKAVGIDPQEVDWLLRAICDLDSLTLRLGLSQMAGVDLKLSLADLEHRWQQRVQRRVPVQYLVGEAPWRQFSLNVSPAVLIPRPETELIIDLAVDAVERSPQRDALATGIWVDMGTGSGAIAIGLADAFPNAQILAVDQSADALAIAQENVQRYDLTDRITLCHGSWFQPLANYRGKLSAVVSNPPYIPSGILPTLQPEVIAHEPTTALDGGPDGLDDLRIIATQAPDYLIAGGLWLAEMMAGQGELVTELLTQVGAYRGIQVIEDLAGRDRFTLAFRI
ncbi:peptide chain release factor N(5)-glutamine methyltransferase [Phormidium sp. FACHB-1136]|uniref:peptide chain release factor N(5)-glutamine methyltransferase n=1 Tax=Phormidium sp. FACHB-1136 TaxID=2692848 RepID=UPI0016828733|nr:peptide chain release factor N(5)-glutamine methyltransferase [Phormidium sp. FACHB-1136]MBD2424782.1 peptide chain release factor N(5)-glutamine methyltransferase [Phormidium sp. FACHB-1136]